MEGIETRLAAALKELEPIFLLSTLDLTKANLVEKYLASATPAVFGRVVACNNYFAGMVRDSFNGLKDCISEIGPLLLESDDGEDENDQAHKEPPLEPVSPVVTSRPPSLVLAPTPAVVPAPPKAPTIEELAQQSIPDGEPPSCPFVTTSSGPAFMAMPLAARSSGLAPRLPLMCHLSS
ncbi:unnamed protein product [Calypogeia fissa]